MADSEKLYEIVESRSVASEKIRTKLEFLGNLEKAKARAIKEAKKNIGVRYSVFPQGSFIADFQVYYRTTTKCPKCGEIIPIE